MTDTTTEEALERLGGPLINPGKWRLKDQSAPPRPHADPEGMLDEFDQMTHECHERNGHKCEGCLGYYPHEAIRALILAQPEPVKEEQ